MTNRWTVLSLLCLARLSMGLHLQVVAAVAPFLIADLDLTYTELGLLIGVFMLPGVFLSLPGGLISRRVGDKATLLAALGLLVLGTGLLAASSGFAVALIARVLSGAGGTLLTMQVAKIATDWFAGRELSTAIGVLLGTFPLGVALAMATLGIVAAATSWQAAVAAIAASAALIFMLVARCYRDPPSEPTAVDAARSGRFLAISTPELRLVILAGVAFALVNAALVVFTSFTPPLLIERGRSETQAGVLASLTSWVLIGTVVLAGYLLDRARHATVWLALSAGLTAMACLATPIVEPAWLGIVLFGIVSAPVTVGSMALPGQVLSRRSRSTGFGLFFTMNYLGFGLLPPVAGFLLDLTHEAALPLWFSGSLYLAILPCLAMFQWLRRRSSRESESRGDPLSGSVAPAE